jgi:hypothetical protein
MEPCASQIDYKKIYCSRAAAISSSFREVTCAYHNALNLSVLPARPERAVCEDASSGRPAFWQQRPVSQGASAGSGMEQFSPAAIEPASASVGERASVRKLIAFDDDTFDKLTQLGRGRMATLQELADEAFADLLKKHGIPIDLKDALRKSASASKTQPATKGAKPGPSRKRTNDSRS